MLAPWNKPYDKPRQCIKKQRHHFANKGPSGQSCGFPRSHVQMYELDHKEGWVLKNYVFKLWCWRRLWRVPWTARRSNQSILKEISPEYSLEGLMLKLKLQEIWPPDVKSRLGGKDPDGGKVKGRGGWLPSMGSQSCLYPLPRSNHWPDFYYYLLASPLLEISYKSNYTLYSLWYKVVFKLQLLFRFTHIVMLYWLFQYKTYFDILAWSTLSLSG